MQIMKFTVLSHNIYIERERAFHRLTCNIFIFWQLLMQPFNQETYKVLMLKFRKWRNERAILEATWTLGFKCCDVTKRHLVTSLEEKMLRQTFSIGPYLKN